MKKITTRYFHCKWTPKSLCIGSLVAVSLVSLLPGKLKSEPLGKNIITANTNLYRNVKGKVLDEKGGTLPGVNVIIKGSTIGTVTDETGSFSLSVPEGESVLTFSYIGHLTQEITVGNQSFLDVTLKTDTKSLEEVVVVGWIQTHCR